MATKKPLRAPARARKISAKAKRAPAAAKPAVGEVVLVLDPRREGLEPILGAAYLMMDRAYASLSGDKAKSLTVTLRPKAARGAADLKALKSAFEAELAAQKLRWAVARNNQSVREYVAENALTLADEFAKRAAAPAEPAAEQLTVEQRSEIERLIAEVETEISEMNSKKELADPKGKTLSWEAAQEKGKGPA
jgi:His-Xaa-Ser system protein HxsD